MCVSCASQVWQSSVNAGGASGVQALFAAGAASVGARGIGNWLAARGVAWVTPARITAMTVLAVTAAIVALTLGAAERVLY